MESPSSDSMLTDISGISHSTDYSGVSHSTDISGVSHSTDISGVSHSSDNSGVSHSDKSNRTSSRPPLLPPCRICGGNASGFHYGVNTCEACKGFFRRSFATCSEYKCAGNNDCPILPRRRRNCPSCRMKKCIAVGMSKGAIKTGRYSYEKKTQYIEEVKSINNKDDVTGSDVMYPRQFTPSSACSPDSSGINFDWSSPKQICSTDSLSAVSPVTESYKPNGVENFDSKQDLCSLTNDPKYGLNIKPTADKKVPTGIPNHGSKLKCVRQDSTSKFVNDTENQKIIDLLLTSQDRLLEDLDSFLDEIKMKKRQKEFHHRVKLEMKEPVAAPSPDVQAGTDSTRMEQMMKVAELMDEEFRNTISFIKAIPGWKTFDMEDQVNLIKDGAAELWILGHYNCIDTELGVFTGEYDMSYATAASVWTDDYVGSVYKTSQIFSKMRLTKEELVVLKTVVLTFPDRCDLINREAVERVQWRMIECLQYVCWKNGLDFNKRFAKIMDGLVYAREMTEKFKDIVKTVVGQWSVFQTYPLIYEFFNSF